MEGKEARLNSHKYSVFLLESNFACINILLVTRLGSTGQEISWWRGRVGEREKNRSRQRLYSLP